MVERTCIVTRKVFAPEELIRFVAGPQNQVVPDIKLVLPGRGVWVHSRKSLVKEAANKGAFARGLKTQVKADPQIAALVEDLLKQQALGALGFARKAGECVLGSGKVEGSIRAGKAIAILHAQDGAEDGLRKLSQAAFAVHRDGGRKINIWREFTSDEMNLALGATNVIHASLLEGGAARNCLRHVAGLEKYREMETS